MARQLVDARGRIRALVDTLDGKALLGPKLPIVNPPLWELGHLGWFQERWLLRPQPDGSLAPSCLAGADALYDSSRVAHSTRWALPLPSLDATWAYLDGVLARCLDRLERDPLLEYPAQVAALHEQMHAEAFGYSRQTLGYCPAPESAAVAAVSGQDRPGAGATRGTALADIEIDGGEFLLGAGPDDGFVFDNEKWAHPVSVRPFSIARCATTFGEFAAFVDAGGYDDRRWWCAAGWAWREEVQARAPAYWRRAQSTQGWEHRRNDRWDPLPPNEPVLHVNAHEAAAWCRWAGRRLPTEAEWELAAATGPGRASIQGGKRRFPWGDGAPDPSRANLWYPQPQARTPVLPVETDALPAGDSANGCRQMIGNTWEWTSSVFNPYPGFVADPYREYSEPWFGTHHVLRGGCFATAASLIRNTWRNFYTPDRRDVYAGFRSCAAEVR